MQPDSSLATSFYADGRGAGEAGRGTGAGTGTSAEVFGLFCGSVSLSFDVCFVGDGEEGMSFGLDIGTGSTAEGLDGSAGIIHNRF